jgi:hypothetical protein
VLFDLANRVFGEVLIEFCDDPSFHISMECVTQFRQRAWRSRNDNGFDIASPNEILHCSGHPTGKSMFFEFMPISCLHAIASTGSRTRKATAWTISTLLVRCWIVVNKHALRYQIWKSFIARIAQEQGPPPISNKHHGIVRDREFRHFSSMSLALQTVWARNGIARTTFGIDFPGY